MTVCLPGHSSDFDWKRRRAVRGDWLREDPRLPVAHVGNVIVQ
jgi:hypothetical protein